MNQTVCPGGEQLRSYLLGATSEEQAAGLEKHLDGCTACQGLLQTLRPEDDLVLGLRGQRNKPRFSNPLIEKLRLQLRQLRPLANADPSLTTAPSVSEAATPAPGGATLFSAAPTAENPYPFLSPPRAEGELGWLGGFRVLRILGAGGMGMVFEAEEVRLKRRVALKVMRPGLAADAHARSRFLREAQATATLVHDNIVAIHQVDEQNGVPFLAMPLLVGEMLEERIKRMGKLPLPEVLRIGKEVAQALAAAHARNIIHRDIKPGNLWVEAPSGRIKVLDFGLAWMERPENEQTTTGAILGTPGYMAPEQFDGEVDARADLFSLGCVLYRLCTGQLAFKGATPTERLRALLSATPEPVQQLAPEVPAPVAAFLMRLLARKKEDRPVSAAVVAKVLESMQTQASGAVVTPAAAVPRPAATPGRAAPLAIPVSGPAAAAPAALPVAVPAAPAASTTDEPTVLLRRLGLPRWRLAALAGLAALLLVGLTVLVFFLSRGPRPTDETKPDDRTAKGGPKRPKRKPVVPKDLPVGGPAFRSDAYVSRPTPIKGLKTWNIESGKSLTVNWVQFLDDGLLSLWDPSKQSRVCWDFAAERIAPAPFDGSFRDLSPDKKTCVRVAGNDAQLWDAGKPRQRISLTHTSAVTGVAFSPDGRVLATLADGVYFWDVKKGEKLGVCSRGSVGAAVSWSPEGNMLLAQLATSDNINSRYLLLIDVTTFSITRTIDVGSSIQSISWAPEGGLVAAVCSDGRLVLFIPEAGRTVYASEPGEVRPIVPQWSPDGKQLVFATPRHEVVVWDVKEQKAVWKFRGHTRDVTSLAFSPDGETVVSASLDGSMRFWDPQTGQHRGTLLLFPGSHWMAISPEGHYKGSRDVEQFFLYKGKPEKDDSLQDYPPAEFASEFGWENKPDLVKLSPP